MTEERFGYLFKFFLVMQLICMALGGLYLVIAPQSPNYHNETSVTKNVKVTPKPVQPLRKLPKNMEQALAYVLSEGRTFKLSKPIRESVEKIAYDLGNHAAITSLFIPQNLIKKAMKKANSQHLKHFDMYIPKTPGLKAARMVLALSIALHLAWPVVEDVHISSNFGPRIHPVLGRAKQHKGTDLATPMGTPIQAVADGVVLYVRRDRINGLGVKIDHGFGLTSFYGHLQKTHVKQGQNIKKKQRIALSGKSGRVTGPHLHFQMELYDEAINPEFFRLPRWK